MMRSVQRILAVFESFSAAKNSLTLQEIADRIELPKSTAFRIVRSLEEAGYLVRLEDQRYCLSFRFTRLGGLVKSTLGIREIARPIMAALAEVTSETAAIYTVMGRNRVCIDSVATMSSTLRTVLQPGEHLPLQAGSAAKILMAWMPKNVLTPLLPGVARLSKRTPTELLADLALVREQGYAISHGERLPGLSAISAPIWDLKEEVHYCVTVNGPTVRFQGHDKTFVKHVKKAATEISLQFGGKSPLP
jgi:DNA-binding IclR family transcriptional regulator